MPTTKTTNPSIFLDTNITMADIEPDIYKQNTNPSNLYTSIKNFGSNSDFGASSQCARRKITLSEFGKSMNFLNGNSGNYGSLLYASMIDHMTNPKTMHGGTDSPHNVYDEYRYSNILSNQNCDVDLYKEWTFQSGDETSVDPTKLSTKPTQLNVNYIAYGGVPFSMIFDNIRNLQIDTSTGKPTTTPPPTSPTSSTSSANLIDRGYMCIFTNGSDCNIETDITTKYDSSNTENRVICSASNGDSQNTKPVPELSEFISDNAAKISMNTGKVAKILMNTGGYTSHSKIIAKYWDSDSGKYIRNIDRSANGTDLTYGPCSAYCVTGSGEDSLNNLCDLTINKTMFPLNNYLGIVGVGQTVIVGGGKSINDTVQLTLSAIVLNPNFSTTKNLQNNQNKLLWCIGTKPSNGTLLFNGNQINPCETKDPVTGKWVKSKQYYTDAGKPFCTGFSYQANPKSVDRNNDILNIEDSFIFTVQYIDSNDELYISEKISINIRILDDSIGGNNTWRKKDKNISYGDPPWANVITTSYIPYAALQLVPKSTGSYPIYLTVSNPSTTPAKLKTIRIDSGSHGTFDPNAGTTFGSYNYLKINFKPDHIKNQSFQFNYTLTNGSTSNKDPTLKNTLKYNLESLKRIIYVTQNTDKMNDPIITKDAMCEGGIIDNAQSIKNLANSEHSMYNVIDGGINGKWVNTSTSLPKNSKYTNLTNLQTDIKKDYSPDDQKTFFEDTVYPVYYPHTIPTEQKQNPSGGQPAVQYQIISDFERTGELSCAEWGILGTKSGISSGNDLKNLSKDAWKPTKKVATKYPNLDYLDLKNGDGGKPSEYYKIVKDMDDSGKKCLQLKVSPADLSAFVPMGNTTANGILCSSMFYGSCEITVRAKFPPVTGGIFGIWTFRSDLESASQSGGSYKLNKKDKIARFISPANPCLLAQPASPCAQSSCPTPTKDCPCETNKLSVGYNSDKSSKILLETKIKVDFGSTLIPVNAPDPKTRQFDNTFNQQINIKHWKHDKADNKDYANGFSQIDFDDFKPQNPDSYLVQIPIDPTIPLMPNYSFIYSENDGTFFGGTAERNDEIDIEIPSNSPGNSWSSDYWSTGVPAGYYCAWRSSSDAKGQSSLHMGMWHRINNNSYTYTNNQGSGTVPYVNMWADAVCSGVNGNNNNTKTLEVPTCGGALMCSVDTGYTTTTTCTDPTCKCNINCPQTGGSDVPTDNQNNQKSCNTNTLKANEYIEILDALKQSGDSALVTPGTGVNTKKQASADAKNISRVQLHYEKLFTTKCSPKPDTVTRTDLLDEKYHDYTISWCAGIPPNDSSGKPFSPASEEYWNFDAWPVKPTATFYIDGKFQSKTSAFIPRRHSRINIGFINPTSEFNYSWHGPFASNVKYAHTYIKRITITPFITDNEADTQSDYWWPAWKDSPSLLRNESFFTFYKPLGITKMDADKPSKWSEKISEPAPASTSTPVPTNKSNYAIKVNVDTSTYVSTLVKNPLDNPDVLPYWGKFKGDDTDNIKPTQIEEAYSNSIVLTKGAKPTETQILNSRIVFLPLDSTPGNTTSTTIESANNKYNIKNCASGGGGGGGGGSTFKIDKVTIKDTNIEIAYSD